MATANKKIFTLLEGTDDARSVEFPEDLGLRFDEWFSILAKIEEGAEKEHVFTNEQIAMRARFQQFLPVIRAVKLLWAYTAEENRALRERIDVLEAALLPKEILS